jgi:hypothetical protein
LSEVKPSFITEQNVCGICIFLQHVSCEGTTSQNCLVFWSVKCVCVCVIVTHSCLTAVQMQQLYCTSCRWFLSHCLYPGIELPGTDTSKRSLCCTNSVWLQLLAYLKTCHLTMNTCTRLSAYVIRVECH